MNGTLAVARYTLIELSRRRILLVFFVVGMVGIAALGIGEKIIYTTVPINGGPQVDPAKLNRVVEYVFVNYLIGALGVFALLIAFAVGMTAIYHDLESGAAVSIFAKPVSRLAFTVGKLAAAVSALVAVVGVLAVEARLVMYLFGDLFHGTLENGLWGEVAAQVANTVVVMLIVLALSTWMNNIIAAVVAFIYNQVIVGTVITVHNFADSGFIDNAVLRSAFDVLYWVVPHPLVSSAIRDMTTAELQLSSTTSSADSTSALAALPPASGAGEILWWVLVVAVLAGIVYYSVRRRQV